MSWRERRLVRGYGVERFTEITYLGKIEFGPGFSREDSSQLPFFHFRTCQL